MGFLNSVLSEAGKREFVRNWPILLTAMVGFALSQTHVYSLGVMVGPLEREFGWARTQITSGLFIISIVIFPFAPLMGRAIDVYGPRIIALVGAIVYFSSIATLSLAHQPIWSWWALWCFVALGHLIFTPIIWITVVSRAFKASRGLALAISMSAAAMMSLGGPLLTSFLVDKFGWRSAYLLLGIVAAVIMLPILRLFFLGRPETAAPPARGVPIDSSRKLSGLSISEALKSSAFLRLLATGFVLSIIMMSLLVNLVPVLTSLDVKASSVPAIAGVVGITQFAGRLLGGLLLDRFNARLIGAISVALPIISCILLINADGSTTVAIVAILVFGLTVGAEVDVLAYLTGRFVGMANFGALFGILLGILTLGNGIGPSLASLIFDQTGSYSLLLWIIPALSLVGVGLIASLGAYPNFEIAMEGGLRLSVSKEH